MTVLDLGAHPPSLPPHPSVPLFTLSLQPQAPQLQVPQVLGPGAACPPVSLPHRPPPRPPPPSGHHAWALTSDPRSCSWEGRNQGRARCSEHHGDEGRESLQAPWPCSCPSPSQARPSSVWAPSALEESVDGGGGSGRVGKGRACSGREPQDPAPKWSQAARRKGWAGSPS